MSAMPSTSAFASEGAAFTITTFAPATWLNSMKTLPATLWTSQSSPNGWLISAPGSSCARAAARSCNCLPSMPLPSSSTTLPDATDKRTSLTP